MTEAGLALVVLAAFLALLVLSVPVSFALGLTAIGYYLAVGAPPMVAVQRMCAQLTDPTMLAIPFFVLCGEIMARGGMARRLVEVAAVFVGFVRGGLAMVNVVASMFFGGISGSSVADTSAIGSLMVPMMVRKGYHRGFSVAITVSSSTQGIIIPPSHNAVLYALAAGGTVSIQSLFLAGYLPGLLIAVSLLALCWALARRRGYPREESVPWRRAAALCVGSIPALVTPLIVILPIAFGWVPAHQAAVLAVAWAALVSTLVYRSLPLDAYPQVLLRTARTSALVLALIATASAFGQVMTFLHVPAQLTGLLAGLTDSRVLLLLGLNALLLLLGMVMDMAPLIVILTPILLPVVTELGLDPVHFGIVLLLNLAVGLCTPPVGSTLFVGCAVGGASMEEASRALLPFYAVMVAAVLLVTFVPEIALWLPRELGP